MSQFREAQRPDFETRFLKDLAVSIGANLRAARKMSSLSQREVGLRSGISYKQVQKYEHGHRVRADELWLLARALNVPIDFFFQGLRGNDSKKRTFDERYLALEELDEHARSVVSLISEMDEKAVAALDELLGRIAGNRNKPLSGASSGYPPSKLPRKRRAQAAAKT